MAQNRSGALERPDTPAQMYAALAGIFLVALGVLAFVLESLEFATIGVLAAQPELFVWTLSGWTAVFWLAMGGLALVSVPRLDTARTYALVGGLVFAAVAVWGFVDGSDVLDVLAAGTANNITHAILGGLGLLVAILPRRSQRPREMETAADRPEQRRFSRDETAQPSREPVGRR